MCVIRRHFRCVRADSGGNVFFAKYAGPSGGSEQSGGKHFFREIRWPVRWVPAVRWRNNYFARNKEALPCGRLDQLSASPWTVLFRWKSFLDHVDHAALRALWRWTTMRPRKGRRGAGEDAAVEARTERSTRVHWFGCGVRLPSPQNNRGCGYVEGYPGPVVGVVGGGEASAAS